MLVLPSSYKYSLVSLGANSGLCFCSSWTPSTLVQWAHSKTYGRYTGTVWIQHTIHHTVERMECNRSEFPLSRYCTVIPLFHSTIYLW